MGFGGMQFGAGLFGAGQGSDSGVSIINLMPPGPEAVPPDTTINFSLTGPLCFLSVGVAVFYRSSLNWFMAYELDEFTVPYAPGSTVGGLGTPTVTFSLFEFGGWRDRVVEVLVFGIDQAGTKFWCKAYEDVCVTEAGFLPLPTPPVEEEEFVLISEATQTIDGASLCLTGLDGDAHGYYDIVGLIRTDPTAAHNLLFEPNGDASLVYVERIVSGTYNTPTLDGVFAISGAVGTSNLYAVRGSLWAARTIGGQAVFRSGRFSNVHVFETFGDNMNADQVALSLTDITANLTSLCFSVTLGDILVGSYLKAYTRS